MSDIRNTDDMIDVRDIIARVEELECEREALADDLKEAEEALEAFDPEEGGGDEAELEINVGHARDALRYWDAHEDATELKALDGLLDKMKGYGGDEQWRGDWHPVTLIRDSYFVDYAEELIKDCEGLPRELPSYIAIDWTKTADNIRVDYSSIEFDGVTYWYR